jgi:ABC-type uncharacterized transport system substrate-binding protein
MSITIPRAALLLAVTLGLLAAPLAAEAQQPSKVPRLGVLVNADSARIEAFRQGLREHGYVDGQSIAIEYRYAMGRPESLDAFAADLVRLGVDILVTEGTAPTLAARKATSTIPIVVTSAGDLVGTGLVASLARPGGNVTGLSLQSPELAGKRLALLRELVPAASLVAVLSNSRNPLHPLIWRETQVAAQTLNVKLESVVVQGADEFESAFGAMVHQRAGALIVPLDPMFNDQRGRIVELAARHRLPAMYGEKLYADAGGLVAYGPNYADLYRRAAVYVDRILKGAKPANLPVEQPTRFELVINLSSAKAIGLAITQSVLLRADEVIQ